MLLLSYIWPIALVIICNTVYQVCAKSVPAEINPLASLTVTYLVAAIMSGLLYIWLGERVDFLGEYRKLNWAPFVLGFVIVGLEVGFIYAYKAGWTVSTASLVQGSVLAAALIFVGWLLFKEEITWNKLVGIAICLVGLFFINYKF